MQRSLTNDDIMLKITRARVPSSHSLRQHGTLHVLYVLFSPRAAKKEHTKAKSVCLRMSYSISEEKYR
jgi:hypothetical protein